MRTVEQQAATATQSQSDSPATQRLVIRVKFVSEEPTPAPLQKRLSKGGLLAVVGVVAIVLGWTGITLLTSEPTTAPAATKTTQAARPQPQPIAPVQPAEPPAVRQPDAPPTPVHEVIPEVPQSALNTIRGTVRVAVLVTIDDSGTVLSATADDPGPSRYFERLSLEAAKKWTFTPASSDEQRRMLLKFNYTRIGVSAHAESPQQ